MTPAKIELLGHVTLYGWICPSVDFPGLLLVRTPALDRRVEGQWAYRALPEEVRHVGPGAIYSISVMTDAAMLASARDSQSVETVGDDMEIPF